MLHTPTTANVWPFLLVLSTNVSCSLSDPLTGEPLGAAARASASIPQMPLLGSAIPKFVDPLPVFGPKGRVQAKKLKITAKETQQQVLPAAIYPPQYRGTTVWGYEIWDGHRTFGPSWPAHTIEAKRGKETVVQYVNGLVNSDGSPPALQAYLTVDQTLLWADPLKCQMGEGSPGCQLQPYVGPQPVVTHLHGGEVPSAFDGGPDAWFTPNGLHGSGFVTDIYTYPNEQQATTLFFHDHTLGATRLNLYAGLAGFYWIRDDDDSGVGNALKLPWGDREIELLIQDRSFDQNGQLLFPDAGTNPQIHPFWRPEFFGDVIVVNGKSWPFLSIEPRRYRFRIANGSNARFYALRLVTAQGQTAGPPFYQIGTDGGLLDTPVLLNDPNQAGSPGLLLAPGERADLIIDFRSFAGQTLELVNSANAPFPSGAPPDPQTTGKVIQLRVNSQLTPPDNTFDPSQPDAVLRGPRPRTPPIVRLTDGKGELAPRVRVDRVRRLTLNEVLGSEGPVETLLNNSHFRAAATEAPRLGATEVWEFINLTADAHPIHLHLVQYQLLNRQAFDVAQYQAAYAAAFAGGTVIPGAGPPLPYAPDANRKVVGGNPDIAPALRGNVLPPPPNEAGWKDTIQANPGQVTRIVVRAAPQDLRINQVEPGTNAFPFDPTTPIGSTDATGFPGGPGYVWHCHIVDHEDNEMMRPLIPAK